VLTGALPPDPEPALAPLVWVTTGVWLLPPEPLPAWEPLVWVTTGVLSDEGADEEPLEDVTGTDSGEYEDEDEPADEAPVVAPAEPEAV
jgi:hypothetical protein